MSEVIKFDTEELAKPAPTQKPKKFNLVYTHIRDIVLPDFDFEKYGKEANEFASVLVETCKENGGLSLSANQCGFPHRVFVMGAGDEYVAFFNPKIISESDSTIKMAENSLTVPFLELKLTRPKTVEVEYQDFNGELHKQIYGGISARLIQQQLDNLDGIPFYSKAKPLALEYAIKKQRKTLKKYGMKMKLDIL